MRLRMQMRMWQLAQKRMQPGLRMQMQMQMSLQAPQLQQQRTPPLQLMIPSQPPPLQRTCPTLPHQAPTLLLALTPLQALTSLQTLPAMHRAAQRHRGGRRGRPAARLLTRGRGAAVPLPCSGRSWWALQAASAAAGTPPCWGPLNPPA